MLFQKQNQNSQEDHHLSQSDQNNRANSSSLKQQKNDLIVQTPFIVSTRAIIKQNENDVEIHHKQIWTSEEEKKLIQLHDQYGNKWLEIAQRLHHKTDGCVKNFFYSKLRKAVRRLNQIIKAHFKKQFKQIPISIIYKLVEAGEERFKEKPNCSLEISDLCKNVQNRLLSMNDEKISKESQDFVYYKRLIAQTIETSKLYKRKSKKARLEGITIPTEHKNNMKKNSQKDSQKQFEKNYCYFKEIEYSSFNFMMEKKVVENTILFQKDPKEAQSQRQDYDEEDQMKNILKQQGLLIQSLKCKQLGDNKLNFLSSMKSSFQSFSDDSMGVEKLFKSQSQNEPINYVNVNSQKYSKSKFCQYQKKFFSDYEN